VRGGAGEHAGSLFAGGGSETQTGGLGAAFGDGGLGSGGSEDEFGISLFEEFYALDGIWKGGTEDCVGTVGDGC
jgi:hypothetical protein